MDNSSASPAALSSLVDGIEEKARDAERDFHTVRFDPDGEAVDAVKEREFTDRGELRAWINGRPDRDVTFVIRFQDE